MPPLKSRFTETTGFKRFFFEPGWTAVVKTDSWDALLASVNNDPGEQHYYNSYHWQCHGSLVNSKQPLDGTIYYKDCPSALYDRVGNYDPYVPYPLSPGDAANSLLARTNPATPSVRYPVFLAELRDIPGMVREMGALALFIRQFGIKKALSSISTATVAKANLAYQFGWEPFFSDLLKVVLFQKAFDQKMAEFAKLSQQGGYKRKIKITVAQGSVAHVTDLGTVLAQSKVTVTGGVRWIPNVPMPPSPDPDYVRRIVLGLDAGNITANIWAGLPWTWLTDRFINIGSALAAGNRTVARPEGAWVKYVTEATAEHSENKSLSTFTELTAGKYSTKMIERYPASASMTASIPIMGANQLSILGSLAVVKNRKVLGY